MKYSIELGPVECRIGSTYEYEIGNKDEERIQSTVMEWYRSLPDKKKRYIKAVDVYPEFIQHGGTFATAYITIRTTCTAGTFETPPKGMTIPEGGEKGWELSFIHRCLANPHLDDCLSQFLESAHRELSIVLDTFKNIKPRVAA